MAVKRSGSARTNLVRKVISYLKVTWHQPCFVRFVEIEVPGNTTDPSAVMDVLAFSNEASGNERSTPASVSKEQFGRVRDNF